MGASTDGRPDRNVTDSENEGLQPIAGRDRPRVPLVSITAGLVLLSLVVLPAAIYGLLVLDWGSAFGFSNLELGLLSMLPGVLLGGLSLVVMLGSE